MENHTQTNDTMEYRGAISIENTKAYDFQRHLELEIDFYDFWKVQIVEGDFYTKFFYHTDSEEDRDEFEHIASVVQADLS